jgi:hypothetical protein
MQHQIRIIGSNLTGWHIEIVDYSGPHTTLERAMADVQRIEAELKERHQGTTGHG